MKFLYINNIFNFIYFFIIISVKNEMCSLMLYFIEQGNGHIQSLIISSILIITGFQTTIFGVLADLLSINRKLIEDVQIRVKKLENK